MLGSIPPQHLISCVLQLFQNNADRKHVESVMFCASMVTGGVVRPNADIIWITDQDVIVDNDAIRNRFISAFMQYGSLFLDSNARSLSFVRDSETSPHWKNVACIPDLAAGAVADCVSQIVSSGESADFVPHEFVHTGKSCMVFDGLFRQHANLVPIVIRIAFDSDGVNWRVHRYKDFIPLPPESRN